MPIVVQDLSGYTSSPTFCNPYSGWETPTGKPEVNGVSGKKHLTKSRGKCNDIASKGWPFNYFGANFPIIFFFFFFFRYKCRAAFSAA